MKILEAKLTVINKEMYIYFFFLCCYEIYAHSHFDLKLFHAKFKVKNFLQREFQKKKLGVKEISILLWRHSCLTSLPFFQLSLRFPGEI